MPKKRIPEEDLTVVCKAYWQRLGYYVVEEVPIYVKIADLFCIDAVTGTRVAVEVKVSDWRSALQQARAYQFGAHFVYIALPAAVASAVAVDLLERDGIGLLVIEAGSVTCALSPKLSGVLISGIARKVLARVLPTARNLSAAALLSY